MAQTDFQFQSLKEADSQILGSLMQFYLYDFSEFTGWDVEADGLFELSQQYISSFFNNPRSGAQLIRHGESLAGFILFTKRDNSHAVSEFFILRKFRKNDFSRQVALSFLNSLGGTVECVVMESNARAMRFWRRVFAEYTQLSVLTESFQIQGVNHFKLTAHPSLPE